VKRYVMAALIAALALPAQAQDVLQCVDTAVTGFKWEGAAGPPRVTAFQAQRFTVQLASMERRTIQWPTLSQPWDYECMPSVPGRALVCASTALPGLNPIIFNGDRFERVGNYSAHVGGDPDLYVAYGTCTRP
jgi:hypothetical protein